MGGGKECACACEEGCALWWHACVCLVLSCVFFLSLRPFLTERLLLRCIQQQLHTVVAQPNPLCPVTPINGVFTVSRDSLRPGQAVRLKVRMEVEESCTALANASRRWSSCSQFYLIQSHSPSCSGSWTHWTGAQTWKSSTFGCVNAFRTTRAASPCEWLAAQHYPLTVYSPPPNLLLPQSSLFRTTTDQKI